MVRRRDVILITTDGSEHSLRVIPHAEAFARACGDRTMLIQVLDPDETPASSDVVSVPRQAEESVSGAIVRTANENGAGMIAMDTRGHDALHHAVHGSTALEVLAKTELPVLLTGASLSDGATGPAPYRVVITSDGSPASEEVIRAIAPLIEPGRFAVLLLRVHEREADAAAEHSELAECEAQLESLRHLLPRDLDVQTKVREIARMGGVDTAIIEEAQAFGAGAIAMSTHGVSAARHLFAGSTALLLLGRSPLPVIMARGAE